MLKPMIITNELWVWEFQSVCFFFLSLSIFHHLACGCTESKY